METAATIGHFVLGFGIIALFVYLIIERYDR